MPALVADQISQQNEGARHQCRQVEGGHVLLLHLHPRELVITHRAISQVPIQTLKQNAVHVQGKQKLFQLFRGRILFESEMIAHQSVEQELADTDQDIQAPHELSGEQLFANAAPLLHGREQVL